jgi:hypothetical protein
LYRREGAMISLRRVAQNDGDRTLDQANRRNMIFPLICEADSQKWEMRQLGVLAQPVVDDDVSNRARPPEAEGRCSKCRSTDADRRVVARPQHRLCDAAQRSGLLF